MEIQVASPAGGAAYDDAQFVSMWTVDGQIGVLPGHADLIATLRPGAVEIRKPGGSIHAVCGSGFVRIEAGKVHISAEQWSDSPDELDIDTRLAEIDETLAGDVADATAEKLIRERAFLEACRG